MVTESDALRSLTIIYGFFFVFMSAMTAAIPGLMTSMTAPKLVTLYRIVWALALASLALGIEILLIMWKLISRFAQIGLAILVCATPMMFLYTLGYPLVGNVSWYGFRVVDLGEWLYLASSVFFFFGMGYRLGGESEKKSTSC